MAPKKQNRAKKSLSQQNSSVQNDPSKPTTDRDRLSLDVPIEVQQHIFFYLRAPEDQKWTNKTDLAAVSLTCRKLRVAVLRDLFHNMKLKFTYTYDRSKARWMVPKLVELIHREPKLKPYVQAMRLLVVPMPNGSPASVGQRIHASTEHIRTRLDSWLTDPIYSPCLADRERFLENAHMFATDPADVRVTQFNRLFGKANGAFYNPVEEVVHIYGPGNKTKPRVFADYALCVMHRVIETQLARLPLTHLDVDICTNTEFPVIFPASNWRDTLSYWAHVLPTARNLNSLRLTNTSDKLESGRRARFGLDHLFDQLKRPNLKKLYLTNWSLTLAIVAEKLAKSFPGLTVLELEFVDIISDHTDDPWPEALKSLNENYKEIEIWVDVFRRRSTRATYVPNLRKRMKGQGGVVWKRSEPEKLFRQV